MKKVKTISIRKIANNSLVKQIPKKELSSLSGGIAIPYPSIIPADINYKAQRRVDFTN